MECAQWRGSLLDPRTGATSLKDFTDLLPPEEKYCRQSCKLCRRPFGTRNLKATFFRYAEHQCEKIGVTLLRGTSTRENVADALETNIEAAVVASMRK